MYIQTLIFQEAAQYPMSVPQDVLEQVEEQEAKEKAEESKKCLNFFPGMKGKTDKQRFIIKVYSLLCV